MASAIHTVTPMDQMSTYLRQKWQEMEISDKPFVQAGHIQRVIGTGNVLYDVANKDGFDATRTKFEEYFANPPPATTALAVVPEQTRAITVSPVQGSALAIPAADGTLYNLPEGLDITDFMPDSETKRLWRMVMGQPKNKVFPDGANQLYLTRPTTEIGEDGALNRIDEFQGPFGKKLTVYPVGFYLSRLYMPPFDESPDAKNDPLCASEDFVLPNVKHAGKFSTTCTHLDPLTQKLAAREDCPLARWRTVDGKRIPPPCQIVFRIGAVMEVDGVATLIKLSFKSIAAPSARKVFEAFNGMKKLGTPIWKFPIELSFIEKGSGNSYAVQQRIDLPATTDEQGADLQVFAQEWADERNRALEWARGTGEGDDLDFIETASPADTDAAKADEFPF